MFRIYTSLVFISTMLSFEGGHMFASSVATSHSRKEIVLANTPGSQDKSNSYIVYKYFNVFLLFIPFVWIKDPKKFINNLLC